MKSTKIGTDIDLKMKLTPIHRFASKKMFVEVTDLNF